MDFKVFGKEGAPTEKLWWMILLSALVFAGFYIGLGPGLLSAGIRFLIHWQRAK